MNIYKCMDARAHTGGASRGDVQSGSAWLGPDSADHYGRRLAQIDLTNLAARVKRTTSAIRP